MIRFFRTVLSVLLALGLLSACNPRTSLNNDNLLKGARAETFILSHGALCARLPTPEAIQKYASDQIPPNSAMARDVKAWDLSGLLDILQTRDGRWVIMPSKGLKKLKGIHFRQGPQGDNEALCFGRLWVEKTIDYKKNKPFNLEDAVSARFEVTLKDAYLLNHFKNLKVESFDPTVFNLTMGTALASTLSPSFVIEMALRPTQTGWYLAKNGVN
jgi:hypothetical protein